MPNVSAAVVETLIDNGIEVVFGIPGTQSLPLNEAIGRTDRLRFVMARHETAVSHQAWGYGETGERMAATVVIPGPGDMNAMNGLKNALNDCTPMVHIAVETEPAARGGDAIHETPPDTYDNVVKANITVGRATNTIADLERAIAIARTPPKGPVRIGIPKNFLAASVPLTEAGTYGGDGPTGVPGRAIAEAARLLSTADHPIVVAGGGIRAAGATEELMTVAERLDAPVLPTYKGKGVVPEDHELFAGIMSVGSSEHLHECVSDADAALAVGTDLDHVTTQGWSFDLPEALVHVTIDSNDIGVGYEAAVGIVADARAALVAIADRLGNEVEGTGDGAERAGRVRDRDATLMRSALAVSNPPLTSASAEAALDDVLPEDGIVTLDAGGFRIWGLHVLTAAADRQFVDTGSWATMGSSVPSAIGAKLANPDAPVVALVGGGGLMMCMQELHTMATEGIPIVVMVLNNDDYATISAEAAANFDLDEGEYAWAGTPVRFVDIAGALGVRGIAAETPNAIRDALTDAFERDEPVLIEVPTDPREPQAKPLS